MVRETGGMREMIRDRVKLHIMFDGEIEVAVPFVVNLDSVSEMSPQELWNIFGQFVDWKQLYLKTNEIDIVDVTEAANATD